MSLILLVFLLSKWRQRLNVSFQELAVIQFFNSPVQEVINYSLWNFPIAVQETSNGIDVLNVFNQKITHFHPHRLAIINQENQVTNQISQYDLIAVAATHFKLLPSQVVTKTLIELGLSMTPIMVRIDSTFSDALHVLFNNRISGIALVDHEGRLSANFSSSDLRGILPEAFNMFSGSILQFLCKGTTSHPKPPITCSINSTFGEALTIIYTEHIHRIYIVDDEMRPHGVVTLTDILKVL